MIALDEFYRLRRKVDELNEASIRVKAERDHLIDDLSKTFNVRNRREAVELLEDLHREKEELTPRYNRMMTKFLEEYKDILGDL